MSQRAKIIFVASALVGGMLGSAYLHRSDVPASGDPLPDGHPCFYIAPYLDEQAGVWYVEDDTARLTGPLPSLAAADSADTALCAQRLRT